MSPLVRVAGRSRRDRRRAPDAGPGRRRRPAPCSSSSRSGRSASPRSRHRAPGGASGSTRPARSGPVRRRSTTWIANRTAAPTASRTSVGWSRWVRQATTASVATTISADERGDPAMEDVGGGHVGDRRERAIRPSAASRGRPGPRRSRSPASRTAAARSVIAVVNAASRVNRWLAPRPPIRAG